jgi:uncharacterized RDD family membrane protein YckC
LNAWCRSRQDASTERFEIPHNWTDRQREGLTFLLADAQIDARWDDDGALVVSRHDVERVRGVIEYLGSGYGDDDTPVDLEAHDFTGHSVSGDPREAIVAGIGRRFLASILDSFILGVPLLVLRQATSGAFPVEIFSVVGAAYLILMIGLLGQTIGDMALHVRVVKIEDASKPGLLRAGIRWAVVTVPLRAVDEFFGVEIGWVWLLIVYVPMFFSPLTQGLHDRAARDLVIGEEPRAEPRPVARRFFRSP